MRRPRPALVALPLLALLLAAAALLPRADKDTAASENAASVPVHARAQAPRPAAFFSFLPRSLLP